MPIRQRMQDGKGKETARGFNGIPNPAGNRRFISDLGRLPFNHWQVSAAVLDDRTDAVPLHGKITPTRMTGTER